MWNYLLTRYFLGWLWVGLGLLWVEFGLLWVGCSSGDSGDSKIKIFCSLTTASVFELGGRNFAWSPYTWGLRYYSQVLSLEKLEKLDTKISMDLIHNASLKTHSIENQIIVEGFYRHQIIQLQVHHRQILTATGHSRNFSATWWCIATAWIILNFPP